MTFVETRDAPLTPGGSSVRAGTLSRVHCACLRAGGPKGLAPATFFERLHQLHQLEKHKTRMVMRVLL
jgi:hypothetical protein